MYFYECHNSLIKMNDFNPVLVFQITSFGYYKECYFENFNKMFGFPENWKQEN
jgi:hypothetical protein